MNALKRHTCKLCSSLRKCVRKPYDYVCNNAFISKIVEVPIVCLIVNLLILSVVSAVLWNIYELFLYLRSSLPLDKFVTIIGSAILAVIGFVFFYMRVKAMDKSAEASLQENQQTLFNTAIEHLGSKEESVRLGGIYALYELAADDTTKEKYRETVHEILCGHIRSKTTEEEYIKQYVDISPKSRSGPSTEIQSLLDILTKKPKCLPFQGLPVDFSDAQLQFANLSSAQLQFANLIGAQLRSVNMIEAQLQSADLRYAQLEAAYLTLAQLQSANLGGAQLQSANLKSAQLQAAHLCRTQLQGAKLKGIQLAGATSVTEGSILSLNFFKKRIRDRIGKPPELDNVTFDEAIDRTQWKGQTYDLEQAEKWIEEAIKANPDLAKE